VGEKKLKKQEGKNFSLGGRKKYSLKNFGREVALCGF
jgi:hypothetical protein